MPFHLLANSLSVILLCLNWITEGDFRRKIIDAKQNLTLKLFVLFYLLHVTGLLNTSNMEEGLFVLQKKISLLAIPIVIATSRKLSIKEISFILHSFVFAISLAAVICLGYAAYRTDIFHHFDQPNWLWFSYRDLTSILGIQPTYLSLFTSFCIFILLIRMTYDVSPLSMIGKTALLLLVLFLTFFLFLLTTRTAIASVLLISFGLLFLYFKKKKQLLKGSLIFLTILIVLILIALQLPLLKERILNTFGINQNSTWINRYGDGKTTLPDLRTLNWKNATEIIKEHPLIGTGTGDAQDELQNQYKKSGFTIGFESQFNSHNQYLQTWLMLGLFGLFSLLACYTQIAILSLKRKNYLFISFTILILIFSLTESLLERQYGIVFYSLFVSIFSFAFHDKHETGPVQRNL